MCYIHLLIDLLDVTLVNYLSNINFRMLAMWYICTLDVMVQNWLGYCLNMRMSFVVNLCAIAQSLALLPVQIFSTSIAKLSSWSRCFLTSSNCFSTETVLLTIYLFCFRNHSPIFAYLSFSASLLLGCFLSFILYFIFLSWIKYNKIPCQFLRSWFYQKSLLYPGGYPLHWNNS